LNEVTVSILYETITITLEEKSLDYIDLSSFLGCGKRHLELVKDLAFEAVFHDQLEDRCPHNHLEADLNGQYVDGINELGRTLIPIFKCLKDNGLRSFR